MSKICWTKIMLIVEKMTLLKCFLFVFEEVHLLKTFLNKKAEVLKFWNENTLSI